MNKKDIDDIQKKIEVEVGKERLGSVEHYVWEEGGQKFSSWKIDTGKYYVNTNDAGMELFEKALLEANFKTPNMENKYFIPLIEDIRVGYTFETGESGQWKPITVTATNFDMALYLVNSANTAGAVGFARVPYLTKEQIEGEGWEPARENPVFHYKRVMHSKQTLVLTHMNNTIWIDDKERGQILSGCSCNDINTFRMVCKLLGI